MQRFACGALFATCLACAAEIDVFRDSERDPLLQGDASMLEPDAAYGATDAALSFDAYPPEAPPSLPPEDWWDARTQRCEDLIDAGAGDWCDFEGTCPTPHAGEITTTWCTDRQQVAYLSFSQPEPPPGVMLCPSVAGGCCLRLAACGSDAGESSVEVCRLPCEPAPTFDGDSRLPARDCAAVDWLYARRTPGTRFFPSGHVCDGAFVCPIAYRHTELVFCRHDGVLESLVLGPDYAGAFAAIDAGTDGGP